MMVEPIKCACDHFNCPPTRCRAEQPAPSAVHCLDEGPEHLAHPEYGWRPICMREPGHELPHRAQSGSEWPAEPAVIVKTHREHVADAVAHERAARWSEASKSWELARVAAATLPKPTRARDAKTGTVRAELVPGTTLHHHHRGVWLASCLYVGDGTIIYNAQKYSSLSAAARAAAKDLGHISRNPNGWVFWGVEKRES